MIELKKKEKSLDAQFEQYTSKVKATYQVPLETTEAQESHSCDEPASSGSEKMPKPASQSILLPAKKLLCDAVLRDEDKMSSSALSEADVEGLTVAQGRHVSMV
ncbi:hypothetical protein E2C01_039600 [Portunus trituberculatus]|uniref:Uncharacterized protein n=1 Tax=Portunus trituberculatus TaxID=210409 RepID=A0A5B7FNG4_PORTR|nr:hypothetical protein [Portunus trituberculatus]